MAHDPELIELENRIASLVQRYAEVKSKLEPELGEQPYVVGWAVAYEFTGTQQEQEGTAGHGVITPDEQMVSASLGLGMLLTESFKPEWMD